MRRSSLIVLLTLVMCGCGPRLARMTDAQKSELLATERGRLLDLTDPVDKTKAHIMISEIILDFAGTAVRNQQVDEMRTLFPQYVAAITSARDVLLDSSRDPQRNPDGYRDLELSLRQQIRRLEDMSRLLTVDEREPVSGALARATSIRDEMIEALFPGQPRSSLLQLSD